MHTMLAPAAWRSVLVLPLIALAACSDAVQPTPLATSHARAAATVVSGSGTWTKRALMPAHRWVSAGAAIDGVLYVAGGQGDDGAQHNTLYAYDLATNTWTTKASTAFNYSGASAVAWRGKLYLFGGTSSPAGAVPMALMYDPSGNSWNLLNSLPTYLSSTSAVACGGNIYLLGGSPTSGFNKAWMYDPRTDSYSPMADMPHLRQNAAAVCIAPNIYITGGIQGTYSDRQTLDIYNVNTQAWTSGTPAPQPGILTAVAIDGIMYMFQNFGGTDTPWAYDPVNDAWATLTAGPKEVYAYGSVLGVIRGRVVSAATARSGKTNSASRETWMFTPAPLVP
jgi:N-acetylneuraminic acid mutarotase